MSVIPHKSPSFAGLSPASEVSSRAKRSNKRKDTLHEIMLRQELWGLGLRYRKHVSKLPGKPDIVFERARVVIFCDGDFWHGRNWEKQRAKLSHGTNAPYWLEKIASNRERDARNNAILAESGWLVIRLWETDIKRDSRTIAQQIAGCVHARLSSAREG